MSKLECKVRIWRIRMYDGKEGLWVYNIFPRSYYEPGHLRYLSDLLGYKERADAVKAAGKVAGALGIKLVKKWTRKGEGP